MNAVRKRCRATGKAIYKKHQDADKALAAIARANPMARIATSKYQCVSCGRWHLTCAPADQTRQLRGERRREYQQRRRARRGGA